MPLSTYCIIPYIIQCACKQMYVCFRMKVLFFDGPHVLKRPPLLASSSWSWNLVRTSRNQLMTAATSISTPNHQYVSDPPTEIIMMQRLHINDDICRHNAQLVELKQHLVVLGDYINFVNQIQIMETFCLYCKNCLKPEIFCVISTKYIFPFLL